MEIPFTSYESCQSRQQQSLFMVEYGNPQICLWFMVWQSPWRQHIASVPVCWFPFTAGATAPLGPGWVFLSTHSKCWSQQPSELSETSRENQVAGGHMGFLEALETCLSAEALQCRPAWAWMPSSKPSNCRLHSQPAEQKAELHSMAKIHNAPDPHPM